MVLKNRWPPFFILVHLLKWAYLLREVRLFSDFPIVNHDFLLYYARALRMHQFFLTSGRFWGYDPFDPQSQDCGWIWQNIQV